MPLQPPSPPPISPRQMNLLRVVTSMAWADGELATEEVDLMLDRLSRLFASTTEQQQKLQQELRDYLMQNLPLDEIIPKLADQQERELVLQLGYEVIASSARTPTEPNINAEEAEAYRRLVQLLNLPPDAVKRIEGEIDSAPDTHEGLIDKLTHKIEEFIQG